MLIRQCFNKLISAFLITCIVINTVSLSCNTLLWASETEEEMELMPGGTFSDNWEDYKGDLETFVYGAIEDLLSFRYDVFPGDVELEDGTVISGICYTDYSECFTDEDEEDVVFMAGMIPYFGEETIPEEEFEAGLILKDIDFEDKNTTFVLSMQSAPFKKHCVIYGQYLVYGMNDYGQIEYNAQEYVRGECDKSIGPLYSYDEQRFVFDNEVGNYVDVSVNADSLGVEIDYVALKKEIDDILDSQDKNFASMDISTYVSISQDAVKAYLLSLQEETFFGYDVSELIKASQDIDKDECIQITEEGLNYIDYTRTADKSASSLVKWLVGTSCVVVAGVSLVGSVVFIECPPLSAVSASIAGVAIESFMQVVVSSRALEDIDWNRVCISASTGAVAGFLGPYVSSVVGDGVAYFLTDSCMDGLIGSIEYGVESWMDGEECNDIIKQAGFGFALGFGLSAGFKAAAKGAEKIIKTVRPRINNAAKDVFPKLSGKVSKLSKNVGKKLSDLKKVADASVFHSKYIGKKTVDKQLNKLIKDADSLAKNRSFNSLSSTGLYNEEGIRITKAELRELYDLADDNSIIGYVGSQKLIQIKKQNGIVGIVFDSQQYQTVQLTGYLKASRKENFGEAAGLFLDSWRSGKNQVPQSIQEALEQQGLTIETINPNKLVSIVRKSDLVMHENIDLKSITLAPREAHEAVRHMGGFSLAKQVKHLMGETYFERFIAAASTVSAQAAA